MDSARRVLVPSILLICGASLGVLGAAWVDRLETLSAGKADLRQYALRLEQHAAQIDRESEAALSAVLTDHLPFCSPQEITFMRGIIYRSSQIKDIGRLKGQTFYCSSETGVAETPFPVTTPDRTFRGIRVYSSSPVMLGSGARGFILQEGSTNVVLSPQAFDDLKEPDRSYAAYLYDPQSETLLQGFGDKLPISQSEVIASQSLEKSGTLYVPLCDAKKHVCVAAAEATSNMLEANRSLRNLRLGVGAALGLSVTFSALLSYRRHRSQANQLRRALKRGTLQVVYQPIVRLSDQSVVAAEALLRWTNEDHEAVNPEVFIALAVKHGLIQGVTRFVIERTLVDLGPQLRSGALRVTINITAEDLVDPGFLDYLETRLHVHGVEAGKIGLELTEASTTSAPQFIQSIAHLRAVGHVIYLDDFGTGYSSLSYLQTLSVDAIKIDRSFTASVGTKAVTESIVPLILAMSEQLGLTVVVEGIETAAQAAYFTDRGEGMLAQGWYFARSVGREELVAMLG